MDLLCAPLAAEDIHEEDVDANISFRHNERTTLAGVLNRFRAVAQNKHTHTLPPSHTDGQTDR